VTNFKKRVKRKNATWLLHSRKLQGLTLCPCRGIATRALTGLKMKSKETVSNDKGILVDFAGGVKDVGKVLHFAVSGGQSY